MKIPRSLSGEELVKALRRVGYETSRQTGSHIRLTSHHDPPHHITVANHDYIRVGTLSAILGDIANRMEISKEELVKKLFN